jgi:hypothetical protein
VIFRCEIIEKKGDWLWVALAVAMLVTSLPHSQFSRGSI